MSVSAGVGGTGVVGVVLGGGAVSQAEAHNSLASVLPFTGASQTMTLVAIALVLLVAGVLAIGLARRAPDSGLS